MSLFSRRRRIEQLVALGDVTGLVGQLVEAARPGTGTDELLAATSSALVDLGDPGITALVEAVLTDPDHVHFGRIPNEVFHRAAGPRAVVLLSRALLRHPVADTRLAAAGMLRRLDTMLAAEAFAAAVTDPDPRVRLASACGLADHGDARGVRCLLEWVAHSDDPAPALAGLEELGDVRHVQLLEELRAAGRRPEVEAAVDRTIATLRAAPAPVREPAEHLDRLRDRLRSIELIDRRTTVAPGPDLERARHKIPDLCANLGSAATALRRGATPLGRPLSRFQVGTGLAALVAEASRDDFETILDQVLESRGVHAVQEVMVEVDRVASELHERSAARAKVD